LRITITSLPVCPQNNIKVKKKFVRYISHEIRTPLNAVRMGLQYLSVELPKITQDDDILDSVETSELASVAAINILNDLLTFDKIEEGNLKLDCHLASAKDLIQSSIAIFRAPVSFKEALELSFSDADVEGNSDCYTNNHLG